MEHAGCASCPLPSAGAGYPSQELSAETQGEQFRKFLLDFT
jgi:hypothetical protein